MTSGAGSTEASAIGNAPAMSAAKEAPIDFAADPLSYPVMPEEYEPDEETPGERPLKPADRAKEKSDELRMHAELAAVFEGNRKFDAELRTDVNATLAREIQKTIGRLEKSRSPEHPVLPEPSVKDAEALLDFPRSHDLTTNDYHVYRRPGEVMIVRWLAGEEVATFYERVQAHFDVGLEGLREDERQANEWRQDADTDAYLAALDALEVKMAERYLRDPIRQLKVFVLSTQTADEMNIAHLCDYVMGVPAAEVVGTTSAPPDAATDRDLAWFFKLFSLRGVVEGVERMCFFTYLQKADDNDW